jgi:alpha-2-macroglobulin-like protein
LKPRYQIKFFDSPTEIFETGNQRLAAAYLASLEAAPTGLDLDELVRSGEIPLRLIEHARSLGGTPAYERYRSNPDFAAVIQLLEGGHGAYSLREDTGLVKLQAAEAHRRAYFERLWQYLGISFLGILFLLPILLLIYYSRPAAGITPGMLAESQVASYVRIAGPLHTMLFVLTLLPMVSYPLGFWMFGMFEGSWGNEPGWIILSFETLVVILAVSLEFILIADAETNHLKAELRPLRIFLCAFAIQFVVSRAGFVWFVVGTDPSEGFALVWLLGSLTAPLVVVGALSSHVRRQLEAKGIPCTFARATLLEILIVISVLFILAGLLLPALAKAKSKGVSISLVNDLKQLDLAKREAEVDAATPGGAGVAAPRVRRDFPETLLWRPELITDDAGRATLDIPLADSITTWRSSIDGVSAAGKMGSIEKPITVFQDFFADIDLPVSMSLGDEVSVPVTCYNYLKEPQDIRVSLAEADWFESPEQSLSVHLGANEVKSVSFPIKTLRVGEHALRVNAQGTKPADAVEREVNVLPSGERFEHTKNDVLKDAYADIFTVPTEAVPESQSLWVKLFPSRFSEMVEGLESIFQAPHGCFEQTSSTTYPNVLVLDYMKRTGKLTPEMEMKARNFINAGYQRLLTFEVAGGGYEWFGHSPANVCLTAYGILEFTDMARVHPVDEAMTKRTRDWLFTRQNGDGSWREGYGTETWGEAGSMTAFVAWALAEAGDESPGLDKALGYLRAQPKELGNIYAKALAANAFLARDRNDSFGRKLAEELKRAAVADGKDTIHWGSTGWSFAYSHDSGLATESTALCTMALMKAGMWPESVKQGLAWIAKRRAANGTFGSTQATILAMRALLQGSTAPLGQDFESTVTVSLNGETIESFRINKDNSDVMRQVDLSKHLVAGRNRVELSQIPPGELPLQLSGVYWLLARAKTPEAEVRRTELLQIALEYDRATLGVNDLLGCTVTVKNNTGQKVNMAMVDLGIPPGFEVDTSAFEVMQQKEQIAKFEATGNQVILYLRELSASAPFQFNYSLRAKYPLRVQTPPSAVYEYYQPQNRAQTKPVELRVAARKR